MENATIVNCSFLDDRQQRRSKAIIGALLFDADELSMGVSEDVLLQKTKDDCSGVQEALAYLIEIGVVLHKYHQISTGGTYGHFYKLNREKIRIEISQPVFPTKSNPT